jgi:hypothetical protein
VGRPWKSAKPDKTNQPPRLVTAAAARRELEDLRAAINYHRLEGLCCEVVSVALPEKSDSRVTWLTRSEAARIIRAAQGARETKKRQPPVRLPKRLLTHLRRWHRLGIAKHAVVEWNGKPVRSVRKGFAAAVAGVGIIEKHVTPHTLRHTSATWMMQAGVDLWQAAGFLGMTVEMLERVYGHHHPNYQAEAAEALSGQKRDRNAVNKKAQASLSGTKIIELSRVAQ